MSSKLQELLAKRKAEKEAANGETTPTATDNNATKVSDTETVRTQETKPSTKKPFVLKKKELPAKSAGAESSEQVSKQKLPKISNSGKSLVSKTLSVATKAQAEKEDETIVGSHKDGTEVGESEKAQPKYNEELLRLDEAIYSLEGFDTDKFLDNIESVATRMDQEVPEIKLFIKEILKDMRKFEDLAYLLNDDQIGLIVGGTLKVQGIEISVPAAAKKKKAATSLQNKEVTNFF